MNFGIYLHKKPNSAQFSYENLKTSIPGFYPCLGLLDEFLMDALDKQTETITIINRNFVSILHFF